MSITKEYAATFSVLAMRKQKPPEEHVLGDYQEFRKWRDIYSKDPKAADDPYERYSRGFRK